MISLFRVREIIIIFSADQAQAKGWLYLPKKKAGILPQETAGDGGEFSWDPLLRTPILGIFLSRRFSFGLEACGWGKKVIHGQFLAAQIPFPAWATSKVKYSQEGIIRSISGWPCTGGEGSGRVWSRPLWLYSLPE